MRSGMMVEEEKCLWESIKYLESYIPFGSKKELEDVLTYGKEIKSKGERKKQEFWSKHGKDDFEKLLRYKWDHDEELEKKYRYLSNMTGLEREKFIEEYLYDDMLYNEEALGNENEIIGREYNYEDFMDGLVTLNRCDKLDLSDKKVGVKCADIVSKIKIHEGVILHLDGNGLGAEGVEILVKNLKLEEGVYLNLRDNELRDEGAEIISHIELKKGVSLKLAQNKIGYKGAIELAKNLKLEEGVELNLFFNDIGDEGAKAIAGMELKEGVVLFLGCNKMGNRGAEAISKIKLKKGVCLHLYGNGIGAEGAKAIAENLKLEEGVIVCLEDNQIGYEGAEALSHMELKEGVNLILTGNQIGDKGAMAMIDNLKLKEGVKLVLYSNDISGGVKQKLRDWVQSYRDEGINCEVLVENY